jgi:hypothetical protein
MPSETLHIVGVFQDLDWARRGVAALIADGFEPDVLTVIAHESAAAEALIQELLGGTPARLTLKNVGAVVAKGPLLLDLQGRDGALVSAGLAATIGRAGFQSHDGYIYEQLLGRGGVLTAVRHQARASDALARLHAYGGGNAAIGAWAGKV